MLTNTSKLTVLALLFLSVAFNACKKDDTTAQELITTVVIHLKAGDGSLDQRFEWNDPDGDGGTAPTVDNIQLTSGTVYVCEVEVYDRSQDPEVDITTEIKAESAAHLFVFKPDAVNVIVTAADFDSNGAPFRQKTTWTAGALSVGSMTIALKHEPDKSAADPDSTGETDFEVSFPVRIL
ncbi:MAG: hypothetical protein EP344_17860 [Bacteroidetes bacterium]|nr:MAG: hypothetical protein EP344_17860 [Bacteroidota bacterium]